LRLKDKGLTLTLRDDILTWLENFKCLTILGIGNSFRGDDAIGLEIIKKLNGKVPNNVIIFECDTSPENFLSKIENVKPTHILIIDAAQIDEEIGKVQIINPSEISKTTLSTHTIPLSFLVGILQLSLKAKIMILGIQPESIEYGKGLSLKLKRVASEVAIMIIDIFKTVT
jgi:hydrogenase 3 maturation protease